MINDIKRVLKGADLDGRKVNALAGKIMDLITEKYARDAIVDPNAIPRKKEEYIHNTKGKKNNMNTSKSGVTLWDGND